MLNGVEGRKSMADDLDNVWSSILSQVRTNASTKMPGGKSILVMGDNSSGKTTLVAKLQGVEAPKKGCGLEYAYIEIRDEYRDDSAQLNVWVVDGNPAHSSLLQFALNESTFNQTIVLLTVSMATPWLIIEQLQFWATVLLDHVDGLKMSADSVKMLRDGCVKRWVDYMEPGEEPGEVGGGVGVKGSGTIRGVIEKDEEEEERNLPSNVLSRNTGLDIVVVVTKTDHIQQLERENDYRDETFDFIQYHIRQFCIQYGAALFYTSVKEDKNCDLLYKYIVHRSYGLPFKTPALIVEKDAVFIPAGWDNEKKMCILQESMSSFKVDDYYNSVVVKPTVGRKPTTREPEVDVEDEQSYLERQLIILQQQSLNVRNPSLTPSPHHGNQKSINQRSTNVSPIVGGGSPSTKKPGGDPSNNPSDRVLANFFNSLLSRKSGGGGGATTTPGSPSKSSSSGDDALTTTTSRSEVAEELDSLLSKKNNRNHLNSSDC